MHFRSFLNEKFRTGPYYRLKEWNHLTPDDQQVLQHLHDSDDVYGIFVPVFSSSHLTAKLAYRNVALLYLHLKEHHHVPHCFNSRQDEGLQKTLAQLVLDRILEIEWNGNYVSGSNALDAIYGGWMAQNKIPATYISHLSMQAISYALQLRHMDQTAMAQRLYSANTTPWDQQARTDFPTAGSIKDFLFSKANNDVQHKLSNHWDFMPATKSFHWLSWVKKGVDDLIVSSDSPTFKLYVSPTPEDFPTVIQSSISILSVSQAFCFKTGASVQGILRPDKMVVYFKSKEALFETAANLEKNLSGFRAHGVPFTSQLDKDGLLSWGIDPPDTEVLSFVEGGSWRTKVTEQLALAILQAQSEDIGWEQAIAFIGAKLLVNGINMSDWTMTEV